ncbi:hypothetical protein HUU05_02930 [candidate division KSB1 bacterium]|nr:hypothetical protein [candidate division KSB1 bacterium]
MSPHFSSCVPLPRILICFFLLSLVTTLNARQARDGLPSPYHPNRPGAQAYAQGGAFVASTGSTASMLFNPAGIAQLEGRAVFTFEAGWNSRTEYLPFFNYDFTSQTRLLQFVGLAVAVKPKWTAGAYFFRPTDYELDFGELVVTTLNNPDGTGEVIQPVFERRQFGLGLNLARSMSNAWHLGLGMEWRRTEVRDEVAALAAQGHADDFRFALGSVVQWHDWRFGMALQSQYKAEGEAAFENGAYAIVPDPQNPSRPSTFVVEAASFKSSEPLTARLGFATPPIFGKLTVTGDAEYKDYLETVPRWQFYGGSTLKLTSFLQLAVGSFTFRKDYSGYVDGPSSEVFLTCGGTLRLGRAHIAASFMEGDLLNEDFEGQSFFNMAVGFTLP